MGTRLVLVITALSLLSCATDERPLENPGYLQIRLVSDAQGGSGHAFADPLHAGQTLQLDDQVLLDLSAVRRVKWFRQSVQGDFAVSIELTDAGAEKLSQITGNNIGRRVGILVGGELAMAPTIMARIGDGRTPICLGLTEEEAKARAQAIGEQLNRRVDPENRQ